MPETHPRDVDDATERTVSEEDAAWPFTDSENTGAPLVPAVERPENADAPADEERRYLDEMVWSHRNVSY